MVQLRSAALTLSLLFAPTVALAETGGEAKDMALVGYHDLVARSAYQPVVHHQGNSGSPTSATTAAPLTCQDLSTR